MFRKADHWIGSRLFVPIIIRICQMAGINQNRFNRYAWTIAVMAYVSRGPDDLGWVPFVMMVVIGTVHTVLAAAWPDAEASSSLGFRVMVWIFFAVNIPGGIATSDWHGAIFQLIILFAEYAATIKTIPPKEIKEAKRKLAEQRS